MDNLSETQPSTPKGADVPLAVNTWEGIGIFTLAGIAVGGAAILAALVDTAVTSPEWDRRIGGAIASIILPLPVAWALPRAKRSAYLGALPFFYCVVPLAILLPAIFGIDEAMAGGIGAAIGVMVGLPIGQAIQKK